MFAPSPRFADANQDFVFVTEPVFLVRWGIPRNREVAEQLVPSVRTVEGRVRRACLKLDVADRDELAKLVRKKS